MWGSRTSGEVTAVWPPKQKHSGSWWFSITLSTSNLIFKLFCWKDSHCKRSGETGGEFLYFPKKDDIRTLSWFRSSKSVMDLRASMFSFIFETDLHIPELFLFPTAYSAFPQHICVALKKKRSLKTMWKTNQFPELLSLKCLIVSLSISYYFYMIKRTQMLYHFHTDHWSRRHSL